MENKTWNGEDFVETPEKIKAFFNDIADVYVKHGFSLGHEDNHGSFEVHPIKAGNIRWLYNASIEDVWDAVKPTE
jgi:hypothetical protein